MIITALMFGLGAVLVLHGAISKHRGIIGLGYGAMVGSLIGTFLGFFLV